MGGDGWDMGRVFCSHKEDSPLYSLALGPCKFSAEGQLELAEH